jgi:hypothetical protein
MPTICEIQPKSGLGSIAQAAARPEGTCGLPEEILAPSRQADDDYSGHIIVQIEDLPGGKYHA